MNVMTGKPLRHGLKIMALWQVAIQRWRRCIGCLSKLSGFDPIYLVGPIFFSLKERFAMRNSYLKQLRTQREQLEAKLELHIARYCFGEGEVDDGTEAELRQRIAEITDEIAALEAERGE
jgi:hypothetical protein